jgi:hypothetical protein
MLPTAAHDFIGAGPRGLEAQLWSRRSVAVIMQRRSPSSSQNHASSGLAVPSHSVRGRQPPRNARNILLLNNMATMPVTIRSLLFLLRIRRTGQTYTVTSC